MPAPAPPPAQNGQLYVGDQANGALLQEVVADTRQAGDGGYDLIIDDGSHSPDHQLQSLTGLWPALKTGGVYMIEASAGPSR